MTKRREVCGDQEHSRGCALVAEAKAVRRARIMRAHPASPAALDTVPHRIAHLSRPSSHRHLSHTRGHSPRPCNSLYRHSQPSAPARAPQPTLSSSSRIPHPPRPRPVPFCSSRCLPPRQTTGIRPAPTAAVWHGARRRRSTRPPCTRRLPPSFPSRLVSDMPSPRDSVYQRSALSPAYAAS
jgi:hypothetical protein